jgi:hypothetical protein
MSERGHLELTEAHPSAELALDIIKQVPLSELFIYMEAFSSCAIENNRGAEICGETLNRLLRKEPVSDRYLLGLVMGMFYREFLAVVKDKYKEPK